MSYFGSPTTPISAEWDALGASSSFYASAGRKVLVCLALVDRTESARPLGLAAWNDAQAVAALDALVDQAYATFGDELFALSFGTEVDRWLGAAKKTERAELASLLDHAIDYAKNHPARPPASVVGITISTDALDSMPGELPPLLDKSDAIVAVYEAVDSSFAARPASSASGDLDALAALAQMEAGYKPILLQSVGYPSAPENASSPEQQQGFYDSMFLALATRRDRFPLVVIDGLYERESSDCVTQAALRGAQDDPAAEAMYCSFGLKDTSGTAKPALASVLDGLATFSSP